MRCVSLSEGKRTATVKIAQVIVVGAILEVDSIPAQEDG
jgi:hypothetical protein